MLCSTNKSFKRVGQEAMRKAREMEEVGVEKDDDMGGNLHLDGWFGGLKDISTFVWDSKKNTMVIQSVWTL